MIEVSHNPENLAQRRTYRVRSVRLLQKTIDKFMELKRPRGLRVRHMVDVINSTLHLETRTSLAMNAITSFLRNGGFLKEQISTMRLNY